MTVAATPLRPNRLDHQETRVDLAAAFRWTARLNMHEAVANHFSVAVNDDGTQFLMNPNQMHFARIKASDLLLIDANDPDTMTRPDAPDPTAWGLHGAIHRLCPHARVAMHVHSIHATVLATLDDPGLPPIARCFSIAMRSMMNMAAWPLKKRRSVPAVICRTRPSRS